MTMRSRRITTNQMMTTSVTPKIVCHLEYCTCPTVQNLICGKERRINIYNRIPKVSFKKWVYLLVCKKVYFWTGCIIYYDFDIFAHYRNYTTSVKVVQKIFKSRSIKTIPFF